LAQLLKITTGEIGRKMPVGLAWAAVMTPYRHRRGAKVAKDTRPATEPTPRNQIKEQDFFP
jgi:hypothetical protein